MSSNVEFTKTPITYAKKGEKHSLLYLSCIYFLLNLSYLCVEVFHRLSINIELTEATCKPSL